MVCLHATGDENKFSNCIAEKPSRVWFSGIPIMSSTRKPRLPKRAPLPQYS